MTALKILTTLSCWILLVTGCICLISGIFYRFTQFDEFKLWQGAMALGIGILTLSGVTAYIRHKLE